MSLQSQINFQVYQNCHSLEPDQPQSLNYVHAKNPKLFIQKVFHPKTLTSKLSHFSVYNLSLCWVGPLKDGGRQILVKNVDNKDVATLSQFLSGESKSV